MKVAAAHAIAELVTDDKLCAEYIIPGALEPGVARPCGGACGRSRRKIRSHPEINWIS